MGNSISSMIGTHKKHDKDWDVSANSYKEYDIFSNSYIDTRHPIPINMKPIEPSKPSINKMNYSQPSFYRIENNNDNTKIIICAKSNYMKTRADCNVNLCDITQNVEELTVEYVNITNKFIECLTQCKSLYKLNINNVRIVDCDKLKKLTQLKSLSLQYISILQNIGSVSELVNLNDFTANDETYIINNTNIMCKWPNNELYGNCDVLINCNTVKMMVVYVTNNISDDDMYRLNTMINKYDLTYLKLVGNIDPCKIIYPLTLENVVLSKNQTNSKNIKIPYGCVIEIDN